MTKILAFMVFYFAIASTQSLQAQSLNSESELFTHFLGNPKASAYDIKEGEKSLNSLKTLQKYFKILRGCNNMDESDECCILSDGEQFCYFSVARPLHIKGRLRLKNYAVESECEGEIGEIKSIAVVEFGAREGNVISGSSNITLDESKGTERGLAQQLKTGKLGEIIYEVEFDIINKEGEIFTFKGTKQGEYAWFIDTYPCPANSSRLNITNLKVGKKLGEKSRF